MLPPDDHAIARFRLRLGAWLALRSALAALTVWAFAWGTVVLALRAALGVPRPPLLWGLAAMPLALLPALWLALRRLPSASAVRALLDRHARCGGLLMAGEEVGLGGWRQALPDVAQPQIRWRGRRAWALLASAAAFVLLAFGLPQKGLAGLAGAPRLEIGREAARLTEQLDVLKEEAVLEPKRAESLKDKLRQLRDESEGRDPVKTLEALDHLQEIAHKSARDAAESTTQKVEELARAEALAETLRKKAKELDAKATAEGMKELARLSRKAAAEKDVLDKEIDPEMLDALDKGALTSEQLKKLSEKLGECKVGKIGRVGKLVKVRLLDGEALGKCKKAGECDKEALEAYLKKNGCNGLCRALAKSNRPGRGGVTRGPGAAKLTFGKESTEDGIKFKEEALPTGDLAALKASKLRGLSTGAPEVNKGGKPAASGALSGAAAGGGSASTPVVLPRHRGAVERYFERPAKPGK
jgi:hypothetical protein